MTRYGKIDGIGLDRLILDEAASFFAEGDLGIPLPNLEWPAPVDGVQRLAQEAAEQLGLYPSPWRRPSGWGSGDYLGDSVAASAMHLYEVQTMPLIQNEEEILEIYRSMAEMEDDFRPRR